MTSNGGTFPCQICHQSIDLINFSTHLTHNTQSGQFLDVDNMFFNFHNFGDVSFEVVQNRDIEMAT